MPPELTERVPLLPSEGLPNAPISRLRLTCLTCGIGGLQIIFSVILSNGSPYLISLGLSQSITALVWFVAPFCGSLIQPLVGSWSDSIKSGWGRRRPFILSGALGVTASMTLLAWAPNIFHVASGTTAHWPDQESRPFVIVFAVICVATLYVSIQLVQAGVRSLIVECLPSEEQARGSKYAGIMQALGNVLGYFFGFLILPAICPVSISSFQALSIFSTVVLCASAIITCLLIKEEPLKFGDVWEDRIGVLKKIRVTYLDMPLTIKQVCQVQFLSWMGWFPLLFYATTYVGEFHDRNFRSFERTSHQHGGTYEIHKSTRSGLSSEAIRHGTFATFLFALITLIGSLLLPKLLEKVFMARTKDESLKVLLIQAWKISHLYFAALMFLTFWNRSERLATALVASAGVSGAVSMFAPFAIINMELSALRENSADASMLGGTVASHNSKQLGIIMAIHNMSISLPQPLGALISSGIFAAVNALELDNGTGWILRGAGILGLVAAILNWKLEQTTSRRSTSPSESDQTDAI